MYYILERSFKDLSALRIWYVFARKNTSNSSVLPSGSRLCVRVRRRPALRVPFRAYPRPQDALCTHALHSVTPDHDRARYSGKDTQADVKAHASIGRQNYRSRSRYRPLAPRASLAISKNSSRLWFSGGRVSGRKKFWKKVEKVARICAKECDDGIGRWVGGGSGLAKRVVGALQAGRVV